jgi:hypothetical protein
MTKIIVTLVLLISSTIFGQTNYQQSMQKAFDLLGEGKNLEAAALFERIASAEKDQWLPNYYVALVTTTTAFSTQDKVQVEGLLQKAQAALDIELKKQPNNPELLVMQGMIYTAWIAFDPMTNGMKLSGKTMEVYSKAEALAPQNPRVVLSKTEFEMGSARFFGTDTKPLCLKMKNAIELFVTFKPESVFHPNWGLDRAQGAIAACN